MEPLLVLSRIYWHKVKLEHADLLFNILNLMGSHISILDVKGNDILILNMKGNHLYILNMKDGHILILCVKGNHKYIFEWYFFNHLTIINDFEEFHTVTVCR